MDFRVGYRPLQPQFPYLKHADSLVILGAELRQGPVESMNVKGSDVVPDSQRGSERRMLHLTTSFLWAVEGAGWIPYSDSDAEMQRGQEGGAESTDPRPRAVYWPPPASIPEMGEGGCGHTLITCI